MFESGYEIIDFPYHTTDMLGVCGEYFSQGSEIKELDKKSMREHGYHENERRECYVVRDGENPPQIASAYHLFEQVHQLGLDILRDVEEDLQMPPRTLTRMVQNSVKPDRTNVSMLRLFHYYTTPMQDGLSALAHEDVGMISMIPRSSNPALEVYDRRSLEWVNVEATLKPNQALVLVGKTLSLASLGEYSEAYHRVVRTAGSRQSIVYHMRANPSAVLDSRSLQTSRTGSFVPRFRLTAGEFLKFEEKNGKSINGAY